MKTAAGNPAADTRSANWREVIARYNSPDPWKSIWQLASSLALYAILFYAMNRSLALSWWLTLALSVPTAGLMVRIFIVFHDCGHGSFFKSRRTCDAVGVVLGVLTFTPYFKWTREHAVHHATVGDLDRRGEGDVWTMTVEEYRKSPRWKRAIYRVYRSPFFLFGVGSFLLFVAMNRFDTRLKSRQDMVSVYGTDLALAGLATGLSMLMGVRQYFMVQVPILFFAAAAGVWLFYVQHQFDGVVWSRHGEWDYRTVALRGSSFYRLPKVLQWFSGNIGYHHAHHLSPRIPNYKLPACSTEDALSREAKVVSLKSSMRSLFLRLWDEKSGRMVGFRKLAGGTGR